MPISYILIQTYQQWVYINTCVRMVRYNIWNVLMVWHSMTLSAKMSINSNPDFVGFEYIYVLQSSDVFFIHSNRKKIPCKNFFPASLIPMFQFSFLCPSGSTIHFCGQNWEFSAGEGLLESSAWMTTSKPFSSSHTQVTFAVPLCVSLLTKFPQHSVQIVFTCAQLALGNIKNLSLSPNTTY